jgi:hypothetical protein
VFKNPLPSPPKTCVRKSCVAGCWLAASGLARARGARQYLKHWRALIGERNGEKGPPIISHLSLLCTSEHVRLRRRAAGRRRGIPYAASQRPKAHRASCRCTPGQARPCLARIFVMPAPCRCAIRWQRLVGALPDRHAWLSFPSFPREARVPWAMTGHRWSPHQVRTCGLPTSKSWQVQRRSIASPDQV